MQAQRHIQIATQSEKQTNNNSFQLLIQTQEIPAQLSDPFQVISNQDPSSIIEIHSQIYPQKQPTVEGQTKQIIEVDPANKQTSYFSSTKLITIIYFIGLFYLSKWTLISQGFNSFVLMPASLTLAIIVGWSITPNWQKYICQNKDKKVKQDQQFKLVIYFALVVPFLSIIWKFVIIGLIVTAIITLLTSDIISIIFMIFTQSLAILIGVIAKSIKRLALQSSVNNSSSKINRKMQ